MKDLLLHFCIILGIASAQAQGKVELKANVLPLVYDRIELSGEYMLSRRVGVEAAIGYEWDGYRRGYRDTITGETVWDRIYKYREINLYLLGKYYFFPKHGGDRLYTGVLVDYQFYSSYTLNGQDIQKPESETSIGAELGYKWVVKRKFIVELGTPWLFSWENQNGPRYIDVDLLLTGKLGYRF